MKKNKYPLVSIITPTFNSAKYLRETIQSVIKQTYNNWELLIIDDASTDKTFKILKYYKKNKKIRIFLLKKNKGPAHCRNIGIEKSNGEYVAFLDSDDIWKKNKLKKQIDFMQKKQLNFVCSNYLPFTKLRYFKIVKPKEKYNFEIFVRDTSICTSSMILNKKIIKKTRFLNNYKFDDYIFKAMILMKTPCYNLNLNLVRYRKRLNSISYNKLENFLDVWSINKKIFKFNFIKNIICLMQVVISSLKKYKSYKN